MKVTAPLIKIDVALNKRIDADEDAVEDADEDADRNDDADGNDDEIFHEIEKPKCTLVIMPLADQIKKFFKLPNVFAKMQAYTAAINAQPYLNHFIKGT